MNKKIFTIICFTLLLTGCVDKTRYVNSLIYYKVAEDCVNMGTIQGEARQNPLVGDYTTEVTAVPKDGYVFVKWNDGYLEASRKDVSKNISFVEYIAYFEAINE